MINTGILDSRSWGLMRPLGMRVMVLGHEILEGNEVQKFDLLIQHPSITSKFVRLTVGIPVFDSNVVQWRNSLKALMARACIDPDAQLQVALGELEECNAMQLCIETPHEVAIKSVETVLEGALRSWFYEAESSIDSVSVQAAIDSWFASGPEWRVLKPTDIARTDQQHGLLLDINQETRSHTDRMLARAYNPELVNLIDVNSTSHGDRINESWRLTSGCRIEHGEIHPDPEGGVFCNILERHAVGLGMNPNRAYLLRPTLEACLDIQSPEEPLVTRYNEGDLMLSGVNLITAVMHMSYMTHEDCIVVSQSAADKLRAFRRVTQLVESDQPVEARVEIGSHVTPQSVIAQDGERLVTASKLYNRASVAEAVRSRGFRLGRETNRLWFRMEAECPMATGDKLTNRHGGKGVAIVVPDADMPHLNGKPIEVCIGPETIVKRRCLAAIWEMMLSRKAEAEGAPIKVDLYTKNGDGTISWPQDENHDFEALARVWGGKHTLEMHDTPLAEETFVGPLFWLRPDKIAHEIVSVVTGRRPRNDHGGFVDNAGTSGQRCNAAKLIALSARGLVPFATYIMDNNVSARGHFRDLVRAVRNI